ncbi:MAG: hypothetical protein U0791_20405 [Gemmataceae bacterium]
MNATIEPLAASTGLYAEKLPGEPPAFWLTPPRGAVQHVADEDLLVAIAAVGRQVRGFRPERDETAIRRDRGG